MDTCYALETFTVKLAIAEPPALTPARCCEDAAKILRPIYAKLDADQEHFSILLLNNKNRVRAYKIISSGSLTSSLVHPREVFRAVALYGAAAVIFAHNHPSGDPDPSPEDIDITRRLVHCAEIFGVRALDSIILGRDKVFSFSDKGMMHSGFGRDSSPQEPCDDVRIFLFRRSIKRKAIAAALNYPVANIYRTLRGYRKVDAEMDAIAKHLSITREHLKLLIAGKAPRTKTV
jgi:hypothetical protein